MYVCICMYIYIYIYIWLYVCMYKRGRRTSTASSLPFLLTLLDLRVSSLRRGHANIICIVPILTDDPRRESNEQFTVLCVCYVHLSLCVGLCFVIRAVVLIYVVCLLLLRVFVLVYVCVHSEHITCRCGQSLYIIMCAGVQGM